MVVVCFAAPGPGRAYCDPIGAVPASCLTGGVLRAPYGDGSSGDVSAFAPLASSDPRALLWVVRSILGTVGLWIVTAGVDRLGRSHLYRFTAAALVAARVATAALRFVAADEFHDRRQPAACRPFHLDSLPGNV